MEGLSTEVRPAIERSDRSAFVKKKTLWLLNMEDFKVNKKILQAGKSFFDCKRLKSRVCENTW